MHVSLPYVELFRSDCGVCVCVCVGGGGGGGGGCSKLSTVQDRPQLHWHELTVGSLFQLL